MRTGQFIAVKGLCLQPLANRFLSFIYDAKFDVGVSFSREHGRQQGRKSFERFLWRSCFLDFFPSCVWQHGNCQVRVPIFAGKPQIHSVELSIVQRHQLLLPSRRDVERVGKGGRGDACFEPLSELSGVLFRRCFLGIVNVSNGKQRSHSRRSHPSRGLRHVQGAHLRLPFCPAGARLSPIHVRFRSQVSSARLFASKHATFHLKWARSDAR
mmetsp:Transcript_3959/g.24940  ORF Transcript_3959/g.24940 Transcript_3959/m.24940 type:complete len:212 (-) Transcript_3959:71-706(-)